MKGTSDEEKRFDVLVIDKELTLCKDQSPVVNDVNWGRSNELNPINQTGQIQWSCVIEWIISCSEYC